MASETETLALHLVRALYDAAGGRPQEWRMLEELRSSGGWLVGEGDPPHSICLTDDGRGLVDRR